MNERWICINIPKTRCRYYVPVKLCSFISIPFDVDVAQCFWPKNSYAGVEIDPRSIRALAKATDEIYSVLRTDAGVAYDARDRSWNLGASDVPDLSDRAARLLGIVYGSQGQQLLQRATTYDLLVQLRHQGTEIDPRLIQDVQKTVTVPSSGGGGYLPRQAILAGGTATIVNAPGVGYKLRVKRLQVSVDAATAIDFRWDTTAFESYYLPANGSVIINKIGENFDGPENTALTIYSSAAVNITASASTETLAV